MKRAIPILLAGVTGFAHAQQPPPEHAAAYAALDNLVGRWTIKGNEQHLETCDWYHGRFHVVCNTTIQREDGLRHAISILSWTPERGYVYSGIGNRGRYETHEHGVFRDGVFEWQDVEWKDGHRVATRIRMGPFDGNEVPFVVDVSTDGGEWKHEGTDVYLRLGQGAQERR